MSDTAATALPGAKFNDPLITATGEKRAVVAFSNLKTLWINTGTLCNITCRNCYIDSSPTNDALAYITLAEAVAFLDEIARDKLPTTEIGFTGGEPFMNPDIIPMIEAALSRGFAVLVLTNAMKPLANHRAAIADLAKRFGQRLTLRVSLDHYSAENHDLERGSGSFALTLENLPWLSGLALTLHIAGRTCWNEDENALRAGFAALFNDNAIALDAADPVALTLLPEMDANADIAEITENCWSILNVAPDDLMCATSRMAVKRKGAAHPVIVACTLIPDAPEFELGTTLAQAARPVALNHPHCARFCVLGKGSCS